MKWLEELWGREYDIWTVLFSLNFSPIIASFLGQLSSFQIRNDLKNLWLSIMPDYILEWLPIAICHFGYRY